MNPDAGLDPLVIISRKRPAIKASLKGSRRRQGQGPSGLENTRFLVLTQKEVKSAQSLIGMQLE